MISVKPYCLRDWNKICGLKQDMPTYNYAATGRYVEIEVFASDGWQVSASKTAIGQA
jgi:hypothetical protein